MLKNGYLQWEDSLDPEGSRSESTRPHLPSPRRISVSPLQVANNKARRRKARKWSSEEEEMLRKGVEQYVFCLPVGIRYLISPLPA
jgi:telomeric repeat-binding factor 2